MEKFILFIKSYRKDIDRCIHLVRSIIEYNKHQLPLMISVNKGDKSFFDQKLPEPKTFDFEIIEDDKIYVSRFLNKDPWRYQQTIKSQVHKLNVCENYLCLDSDSVFIKHFYLHDFMYDENTPYTIMHEAKDMREIYEMTGVNSDNLFLLKFSKAIRKLWPRKGKMWDYGPSPYIWSTKVWNGLETDIFKPKNYTMDDFFIFFEKETNVLPSEALFYGEYLLQSKLIDIIPVQPLFKVFHEQSHAEFYEKNNLHSEAIKRIYYGIVKQSNWQTE